MRGLRSSLQALERATDVCHDTSPTVPKAGAAWVDTRQVSCPESRLETVGPPPQPPPVKLTIFRDEPIAARSKRCGIKPIEPIRTFSDTSYTIFRELSESKRLWVNQ